jgi:hypothetical protein
MPIVAKAVPSLLHMSLFLFFVGLCDSVFNINTAVGISTTIPIGISGLVYIFMTFAPIIYLQLPYQTSFSGLIWYIIQKIHGHQYKDRGSGGTSKPVSLDMAQGQMQLAMEDTEDWKGRDERSIRWLVSNMTEDAEMESFVMAIPGSFNRVWGVEVWKDVSKMIDDKNKSTSCHEPSRIQGIFGSIRVVRTRNANDHLPNTAPHVSPPLSNFYSHSTTAPITGEDTMGELSVCVAHVLETCKNRNLFTSDELWQRCMRACVETAASLVCCAGAEVGQFGDIVGLLADIGSEQNVRGSLMMGKDQSFVMHWTCLSLVAIQLNLGFNWVLRFRATRALESLESAADDDTSEEQAVTPCLKATKIFNKVSDCLNELGEALAGRENLTEDVARQILSDHKSQISELEHINIEDDNLRVVDRCIGVIQRRIDDRSHGIITCHLPGVNSDDCDTEPIQFSQFMDFIHNCRQIQFIFYVRNLKRIRSVGQTFQGILEGQWDANAFQETSENLQDLYWRSSWRDYLWHQQLWRLQDLRDSHGLGFTVELFFLALNQLLSKSSSKALYVGAFQAITSDWSKCKHSLGTQKLLLDMVMPCGLITVSNYPGYIVDEFLKLLGDILEGQTGPHIDDTEKKISGYILVDDFILAEMSKKMVLRKALDVIARARASSS